MHLKKLELYGFKSFADKVEIDFDTGITGVVGPNGSGKSNIGDAMRWVLGESSARSLRGAHMEDVIFNGAQKRNPLGWCEVTLIFDNSDGVLDIDFTEVAISRRVYRNGEGEYFINRSECRRKDIIELFRDTGIGREGYSIIGQGRIEDILSHKPDERRDVFHEAAGIMKYRARRDEAGRRLDSTRKNIQRLYDIMEEMERQLAPLKRQSKNARRYIEISNELKVIEINRFLKDYDKSQIELKQITSEINQMTFLNTQEIKTVEENDKKLNEMNNSIDAFEGNIQKTRHDIGILMEEINQRHGQKLILEERLTYTGREQKRLKEEWKIDQSRIIELEKEKLELNDALKSKGSNAHKIKDDLDSIRRCIKEIAAQIYNRQNDIDEKKNVMMDELTQMADIKSSSSRLDAMLEAYSVRRGEIEDSLNESLRQKQINDDIRPQMKKTVDDLFYKISMLQKKIDDYSIERNNLKKSRKTSEHDMQSEHDKSHNIETRIQMLKTLIKEHEGFSNPVKFLLSHKNSDELAGGVVADIIDVPKQYISAIERALGSAMQHIITRSDYEAKELISILRKNNAGRATFLPIDAIRRRFLKKHEEDVLSKNGCIGIAAQLIDFDDKYYDIIHSLLGRTIICDNIDNAVILAKSIKYSCRFVTLKGDMVNPGGSISGGSKNSKESSPITRRSQLEELKNLGVTAKNNVKTASAKLEKLNNELNKQRQQMDSDITSLNETRIDYTRQKERFDKLQTSTQSNDVRITHHNEQLDKIVENIEDAKAQISNISKVTDIAQKKDDTTRVEIMQAQKKVNQLRENHDEMQEHLEKLISLDTADEKELAAAESKLHWLKNEIERLAAQITVKKEQHEKNIENSFLEKSELDNSKIFLTCCSN